MTEKQRQKELERLILSQQQDVEKDRTHSIDKHTPNFRNKKQKSMGLEYRRKKGK